VTLSLGLDIQKLLRLLGTVNVLATTVFETHIWRVLKLFGNAFILATRLIDYVKSHVWFESSMMCAKSILIIGVSLVTTEAVYATQIIMVIVSQSRIKV
jgi:hypothetical protein